MNTDRNKLPVEQNIETLEEFKNSLSYGSRSDLNFKFLKSLTADRAGLFLQQLLNALGDSLNDGSLDRVGKLVYEGQAEAYDRPGKYTYEDGPFHQLSKPVKQLRLALMATSGHFVAGSDPEPFGVKDMSDQDAEARIVDFLKTEPQLSEIPVDTPEQQLRVRHGGYDVRGARTDPNIAFPVSRLRELQKEGIIGELFPTAYSFVGACSQMRLLKHTGPQWVEKFQSHGIEALLLVPV